MKQDKETIRKYLPAGWEEAAKSEKALVRSRNIQTAEDLLFLNILYLTEAGSYQNASTLMQLGTNIRLNKEAARKRIIGSGNWLRWMSHELCLVNGYAIQKPGWIGERCVLVPDATDVALKGSNTSDYRMHYAFDLFGFTCAQMELTTIAQGGERLNRYALRPGDIVVADRMYGTVASMTYVESAGAEFVLRLRTNAFGLYEESGKKIDLLSRLSVLKPRETLSLDCFYRGSGGAKHPVRIVASRKDEDAGRKAAGKVRRAATHKRGKEPSPSAMAMADYMVLATNLPDTTQQIVELYRARWQVEKVFHRLKGLFNFGEPPGKNPKSVMAWFHGKLFMAALCEAMTKKPPFSPV